MFRLALLKTKSIRNSFSDQIFSSLKQNQHAFPSSTTTIINVNKPQQFRNFSTNSFSNSNKMNNNNKNNHNNPFMIVQKIFFSTTQQNPSPTTSSNVPPDQIHRDNPELWTLRVQADKNPTDVGLQAAYLRKLNEFAPQEVILRAANDKYARNESTKRELLLATLKVNPNQFYSNILRGNTLEVSIKENWRSKIVSYVLVGLGVVFVVFLMFGSSGSSRGANLQGMFEGHYTPVAVPDVKFNDVKGNEESKEELLDIAEYLKNPAAFSKFKIKMPKGVLLTGPPGCGKTLLARALAGEAGVPFFHTSGSEFEEMLVGVGAKRMRELFSKASEISPCIIFIDEIDAIGGRRDSLDLNKTKLTLNQLLVQLDGFEKTEGIVVIAATNMPETLDPALTRPGRFDRRINLSLPDVRARAEILKMYLQTKGNYEADIEFFAKGTVGFSGADLENMANMAAISALKNKRDIITAFDLMSARDTVVMGPERKSLTVSVENKKLVAYHEAGHAIVAYHIKKPIEKATVMPRGSSLGHVSFQEKDDLFTTKESLVSQVEIAMGGRASEEVHFGVDQITQGAASDFKSATRIAKSMVENLGMNEKVGLTFWDSQSLQKASGETKNLIEHEVKTLLEQSYQKSFKIIKENRDQVERLAEALLKYETLSGDEVISVIEGRPIKRSILSPATITKKPMLQANA